MLSLERIWKIGIFDPALGGDPVLFQHMFWFYSHPAVYIMILPGMGVISEVVTCFSRKRVFGYSFIAFSSIAIAVFGFVVWAHHMFVAGISMYSALVFSLLSFPVAQDYRAHVSGSLGQAVGAGCVHRFQPDVLPAVHPRLPGHAATLRNVSSGIPGVERTLERGRFDPGGRIYPARNLFPVVAQI